MNHFVPIIGGGPAGLMAAEVLSEHGLRVDLYDAMPSLGRKFLMAGKSGLNLTHSEPFEKFIMRYGDKQEQVKAWLLNFSAEDLRAWAGSLGVETFVGTSGRVFPTSMKASPLLRAWLKRLTDAGVTAHPRHKWVGWSEDGRLKFETGQGIEQVSAPAVILALGGGSWARLGSSGEWVEWLRQAGVKVETLKPANCGFDVAWTPHFAEKYNGQAVKSTLLSFGSFHQQGEFVITTEGIEGGLIYAASALMREEIALKGSALMTLDLAPDRTEAQLIEKLARPRGSKSMASHLEKTIGLKGVKAGLLREFVPKDEFTKMERLAYFIKHLSVRLAAARPLDEAISSAGGVSFEALDESLMLKKIPGVFCAGEMLDWEAPTGGYLLTACFASGRTAAHGVLNYLGGGH